MNRKGSFIVFLLVLLIVPAVALASSYDVTYSFDSTLTGQWRTYDGQNIEFELNSTANGAANGATFTAKLHRKYLLSYDIVGSAPAPQNGSTVIQWSNVGPGTYRSYFAKNTTDGVWVVGNGTFRNY